MEQNSANEFLVILEESENARWIKQLHLVLAAASIDSKVCRGNKSWTLLTAASDTELARKEIDAYKLEQTEASRPLRYPEEPKPFAASGVLIYLLILGSVMYLQHSPNLDAMLLEAGEMQSSGFRAGQWWRCFTAMTLHRDTGHLVGNLAMGGLYGWMASTRLGTGIAWLGIITAGALGNGLSGMIRPINHHSIGASTAVFAALGILSANATCNRDDPTENQMRRWLPLVSGGVLLAWTGTGGPQTDVLSHLTGFSVGIVIGSLLSRTTTRPRRRRHRRLQASCALLSLTLVLGSWLMAFA